MIDADLSARAQGLLLRWLRRPPGAEIDDIGAMVKRSKREGKKRLEGRDALYKASYELEEEGFLVREQERSGSGQYEWVVRIYSSPVPLDSRSNPEDRKRTPRVRTASQNRRSAPVPENPELENQESADQESADQELSFKDSVNDSLSGGGSPTGDGSEQGEREAAAPGRAPADVVVDAYVKALGHPLVNGSRAKLRAQAVQLLAAGHSVALLVARAAEMPANGWTNLIQHVEHPRVPGQQSGPGAGAPGGARRGEPDAETRAAMAAILARGSGL
ncbi:hypothetical protein [Streptomyces sp. NPDC059814]|uniref:hypothetical protein n=1 Tax=Streptomyces sp. NPDC059814 TaxID=3346959 RepID=UPI00364EA6F4